MKTHVSQILAVLLLIVLVGLNQLFTTHALADPQTQASPSTEAAYRANNLGVALLEQFKYKEGADAFKRALQIDPKLALARINLAIALFNLPDLPGAQREAQAAIALAPNAPQPHYILGLIAKTQARADDAIAPFQQVLKIDPNDVGANVNLGQIYSGQKKYPEAIAAFRAAVNLTPSSAAAHRIAAEIPSPIDETPARGRCCDKRRRASTRHRAVSAALCGCARAIPRSRGRLD